MKKIKLVIKYIIYCFSSKTKFDLHSPFAYKLVTEVVNNRNVAPVFHEIKIARKKLNCSEQVITIKDLGAGSLINSSSQRKIKDIAKNSAKSDKYGKLLYNLVAYFKPKTILELGTSLGVSTLYLALGNKDCQVLTLEGCPETAEVAGNNFLQAGLKNIEIRVGDFKETLVAASEALSVLDFVFFDGNHQKIPTMNYFNQCLLKSHADSVFVFDDIHWSEEMEEAWEEIKKHPKVKVTMDLFFVGLVFFRNEQEKEHFVIKY